MAPKQHYLAPRGSKAPKGYFASAYASLTSPDNAAIVQSVAFFGATVAFLSTSLGEAFLVPVF